MRSVGHPDAVAELVLRGIFTLRRHELEPDAAMVDVLLQSGDALKAQLARHQGNGAEAANKFDLGGHTKVKAWLERCFNRPAALVARAQREAA